VTAGDPIQILCQNQVPVRELFKCGHMSLLIDLADFLFVGAALRRFQYVIDGAQAVPGPELIKNLL
jgi:hypothetical protein